MRNGNIILLILVLIFVCSSCGRSEAVVGAEKLVDNIVNVSLESKDAIIAAENAYNSLTDAEKQQYNKLSILQGYRLEFDTLCAKEVEGKIAAIPDVVFSTIEIVENVRIAYDALDDSAKGMVSNYDVLLSAEQSAIDLQVTAIENKISAIGEVTLDGDLIRKARASYTAAPKNIQELVSNYDLLVSSEQEHSQLKVENANFLISSIGKVTVDSEIAINKAKTAYSSLTEDEKNLVENRDTLFAAEVEFPKVVAAAKEAAGKAALATLRTEEDSFEEISWYYPKSYPQYINKRSFVLPYMGSQGGKLWLRLKFNYYGEDWIFYKEATIKIDGDTYSYTFDYFDMVRDNHRSKVWETADISVSNEDIKTLEKIANSKSAVVRFYGDEYYYDLTISATDKQGIANLLTAYEYLGGK